jgi:hypothetical protein
MTPETDTLLAVCTHVHPTTGDVCALNPNHVQDLDPRVQQHVSERGVKWPSLHELAPEEGYNDYVTRGV